MDRTIADLTEYILSPRGRLWPGPNSEPKSAARRAHHRHSPTAVRAHSRLAAISRLDMPRRRADRRSTALGPSHHQPPSGRDTSCHAISTMPVALAISAAQFSDGHGTVTSTHPRTRGRLQVN